MLRRRYRRSYDSEFTAPLVAYHVWPALMEDSSVLIKGEATTRRGAVSDVAAAADVVLLLRVPLLFLHVKKRVTPRC